MYTSPYECTAMNVDITLQDVAEAVGMAHKHKALGMDGIPSDALKTPRIVIALHNLFSFCFQNSVIPSEWTQSIINPIPKAGNKDSRDLLQVQGDQFSPMYVQNLQLYFKQKIKQVDRKQFCCQQLSKWFSSKAIYHRLFYNFDPLTQLWFKASCWYHQHEVLTTAEWILHSTGDAGPTFTRYWIGVSLYSVDTPLSCWREDIFSFLLTQKTRPF